MEQQVMTFTMSTLQHRGMVAFSPEGLDIIRSLLLRWIEECERSEERAIQFGAPLGRGRNSAEATYYRNAGSFLRHLLTCRLKGRVKLADQLRWVGRWKESCDLPQGWLESIKRDLDMGGECGTNGTVGCGCGTRGVGGNQSTQVGDGQERPTTPRAADVATPVVDPRQGSIPDGPGADESREVGTGANRGRGGQRDAPGGAGHKGRSRRKSSG